MSNTQQAIKILEQLEASLNVVNVQGNKHILVIQVDEKFYDNVDLVRDAIQATGGLLRSLNISSHVRILVFPKGVDIMTMNDEQMQTVGLYRSEQIIEAFADNLQALEDSGLMKGIAPANGVVLPAKKEGDAEVEKKYVVFAGRLNGELIPAKEIALEYNVNAKECLFYPEERSTENNEVRKYIESNGYTVDRLYFLRLRLDGNYTIPKKTGF